MIKYLQYFVCDHCGHSRVMPFKHERTAWIPLGWARVYFYPFDCHFCPGCQDDCPEWIQEWGKEDEFKYGVEAAKARVRRLSKDPTETVK